MLKPPTQACPQDVLELVERFREQLDSHRSGRYDQTQLRLAFLDPFFQALGWNANPLEPCREVVRQEAVGSAALAHAPDYAFRIGGTRKFFAAAKKPSARIAGDVAAAYPLRRYAWSAKLPLGILTDFEELAVYDCRIRPNRHDDPAAARIFSCTFEDYAQSWTWLAGRFSRESVVDGALDRFAETTRTKKGASEVDAVLLADIERWRTDLAGNIARRNESLTERALNVAVQQIIDRILFLRICEDRGIEDHGRLRTALDQPGTYVRLCALFEKADARYHSSVFHFPSENGTATPSLNIDDEILETIIRGIDDPDCPYEFSVISADILGQIYERFLGKIIRLTPERRAVVEEKPEVKRAGGVYYTPTDVVDFIVENTLGRLLAGKTPTQVSNLKVVDPACGSGCFLIGAYEYLLSWHLTWYLQNDPNRWAAGSEPALVRSSRGGWQLSIHQRKQILRNHVFGVDIDPRAVEVTKLSLLLKLLERETGKPPQTMLPPSADGAFPELGDNIKCGNSLIGPELHTRPNPRALRAEDHERLRVFDWPREFAAIFANGGFDAVIGNPPWGALLSEPELEYLRVENEKIIVRMIDSFMYFVHQSSLKLRANGIFGMIVPDVVLYQTDNRKLRELIVDHFRISNIVNMGDVFDEVTRPASILIYENARPTAEQSIQVADLSAFARAEKRRRLRRDDIFETCSQQMIRKIPGSLFVTSGIGRYALWEKVTAVPHRRLKSVVDEDGIQRGVSPDLKEAFVVDDGAAESQRLEIGKLRAVVTGGIHVKRYRIQHSQLKLIYTTREDDFGRLPRICRHIEQFREQITCKEVAQNRHPLYALHRARDERIFTKKEKLIGVITEDEIVLALDRNRTFATDGLYVFGVQDTVDIRYVMGILNSKLFVTLYRLLALESGRVLAQVKPTVLAQLPIRTIDPQQAWQNAAYHGIVASVEDLMSLRTAEASARSPHEQAALSRQAAAIAERIDRLVYELYELSDGDIEMAESKRVIPPRQRRRDRPGAAAAP